MNAKLCLVCLCLVTAQAVSDLWEFLDTLNLEDFSLECLAFTTAMHGFNVSSDGIVTCCDGQVDLSMVMAG